MKNIRFLWLAAGVTCFPAAAQAGPFYVLIEGGYSVTADNTFGPAGSPGTNNGSAPAFTGELPQSSVSVGPLSGSETGVTRDGLDPTLLPQEADAMLQATATIGALHAVARVSSNSSDAPSVTSAQVMLTLQWSDTVTFHTPTGSADFTATLVLDDIISDTQVNGAINGSATAFVEDNLPFSLGGSIPFDSIIDTTDARAPVDSKSATIHVVDGQQVTFTGELEVVAFANDTASVAVDASDTAGFFLTTNDPDASYSTASGTRFDPTTAPVAAPEPPSAALLAGALFSTFCLLRFVGRRRPARSAFGT